MRSTVRALIVWGRTAFAAAALLVVGAPPAAAQNITIAIPGIETFVVQNVQNPTTGTPQMTITWSTNSNFQGNHLRISVRADAANFTAPVSGRTPIAANKATWTIASATNGTGTAGTVSSTAYTAVYNASNGKKSGSVVLNWNLGAAGTNIFSGSHLLTLRWRLESVP